MVADLAWHVYFKIAWRQNRPGETRKVVYNRDKAHNMPATVACRRHLFFRLPYVPSSESRTEPRSQPVLWPPKLRIASQNFMESALIRCKWTDVVRHLDFKFPPDRVQMQRSDAFDFRVQNGMRCWREPRDDANCTSLILPSRPGVSLGLDSRHGYTLKQMC